MNHIDFRKLFPLLAFIFSFLSLFVISPIIAAASETSQFQHIYDDAALLSSSELSDLEDMCVTYGEDADVNIFILTHEDASAVDAEIYIENFYDNNLYGTYTDSVILLIDMANRDVMIEGFGTAETYIHSNRIYEILEDITPYLTDGDYVTAFEKYIKSVNSYMLDTSDPNYSRDYTTPAQDGSDLNKYIESKEEKSILENGFIQLVIAAVIGAGTVGIMAYNSGGRMTAGSNTYIDPNHSGLIGRSDTYLRTTVTRVRKPENNNSGGGFQGGVSAGGHSHSSGRGKF